MTETGVDRQGGQLPAGIGDPSRFVDCRQGAEEFPGLSIRTGAGRVQPAQFIGVTDAPQGQFQGQTGQVDG